MQRAQNIRVWINQAYNKLFSKRASCQPRASNGNGYLWEKIHQRKWYEIQFSPFFLFNNESWKCNSDNQWGLKIQVWLFNFNSINLFDSIDLHILIQVEFFHPQYRHILRIQVYRRLLSWTKVSLKSTSVYYSALWKSWEGQEWIFHGK